MDVAWTPRRGEARLISRETIEDLYRRHNRDARRLAFLLTGDSHAADDIVQEAFLRAIGRLAHLRNPSAFGSYLRTTVLNIVRMQHRRWKVEKRHLQSGGMDGRYIDPNAAELEDLRRSLLKLGYKQRCAIVLRFYADLSYEEIADAIGCAPGTARSLVSRGLAQLGTLINGGRHG